MRIVLFISIITLCILAQKVYCNEHQTEVDSLKAIALNATPREKIPLLIQLSSIYWDIKPDTSLYFAEQALELAKSLKNDALLGDAFNSVGNAYHSLRKYNDALDFYKKGKEHRDKVGDYQKIAFSFSNIALAYTNLNKFSEAISSYKEAAELCQLAEDYENEAYMLIGVAETYSYTNNNEKALEYAIRAANVFIHFNMKIGLASTYNFIGSIHQDLNNTELAKEYYSQAYYIYLAQDYIPGISTTSNNLGIVYDELGENDKALEFYTKSLNLSRKNNDKQGEAVALNNIGYLNAKLKNYQEALDAYFESVEISTKLNDYPSIMNTYNNIAWVYYHSNNIDRAKYYVLKGLEYDESTTNLLFKAESHEILSKIFLKENNFEDAYKHKAALMKLKDSLFDLSSNEKVLEMQLKFETERKEQEIELLKKGEEISKLKLQRQRNINIIWVVFTTALIALVALFLFNLNAKKKINTLLTEKNKQLEEANTKLIKSEKNLKELNATKDRLFSIIAHDLRNPFTAVVGLSELLNLNFDEYSKDESKELIKNLFESSLNLYKLLENLLQWSRSQIGSITYKPELFPVLPLINQEVSMLETLIQEKNIKIINRVEEHLMVFADRNLIAVVIRNLLSNAIKFSNVDDKITITAQEDDKICKISISDSGIGLNTDDLSKLFRLDTSFSSRGTANEQGTGLGLILCKEFVEKNNGTISATSEEGKGSIFTFTLPSHRSPQNI